MERWFLEAAVRLLFRAAAELGIRSRVARDCYSLAKQSYKWLAAHPRVSNNNGTVGRVEIVWDEWREQP